MAAADEVFNCHLQLSLSSLPPWELAEQLSPASTITILELAKEELAEAMAHSAGLVSPSKDQMSVFRTRANEIVTTIQTQCLVVGPDFEQYKGDRTVRYADDPDDTGIPWPITLSTLSDWERMGFFREIGVDEAICMPNLINQVELLQSILYGKFQSANVAEFLLEVDDSKAGFGKVGSLGPITKSNLTSKVGERALKAASFAVGTEQEITKENFEVALDLLEGLNYISHATMKYLDAAPTAECSKL